MELLLCVCLADHKRNYYNEDSVIWHWVSLFRYFRPNLRSYFAFVVLLWQQSSVLGILMPSVVIDTECIKIGTAFWKQISLSHSFSCAKHYVYAEIVCLHAGFMSRKRHSHAMILKNTRNPIESLRQITGSEKKDRNCAIIFDVLCTFYSETISKYARKFTW